MQNTWEEDGDPWRVTSRADAFANDWFRVDAHKVVRPDGAPGTYDVIRIRRLAVGVLPIEPNGDVHLVGQWRFPLGRYSWEMPEGGAELGEEPRACALRELAEETGLAAAHLAPVLEMDLSNSLTDEKAVIYIAHGLSQGQARPEGTEVLRTLRAPFADVLARVIAGGIRDSMTVAAVLRAHHMAVTGELPQDLARAMLGTGQGD